MYRISDSNILKNNIINWIKTYADKNMIKSLVVGISGGIDSAVVSTLCAETGLPTYVITMPLHQAASQDELSDVHRKYLVDKYSNIIPMKVDLTTTFDEFVNTIKTGLGNQYASNTLALANTRSRLRMITLYQVAGSVQGIVAGTGNKVEDYGIGFYTKYGDGGVDIAPIADLYKTEVWELGRHLGIDQRIINAKPTDGLWDDGRTDEDQIGTSYANLEWAMDYDEKNSNYALSDEQSKALSIYRKFNKQNKHKMVAIPMFKLE
jgi:NAD+ synthase